MGRSHPAHLIIVLELLLFEFGVDCSGDEAAAVCTDDLLVIFDDILLLFDFDFVETDFEFRLFLFDDFLLALVGVVIVDDGNCAVRSLKLTPIMSSFNVFSNNKLLFVVEYDNVELFM
jgi:hypothetical protein